MKVVGAFGWMSEDDRRAFKQALNELLIKVIKPLGLNESEADVKQFNVDTNDDSFVGIASVVYYKPSEIAKWKELYNEKGFKGIEKELNKSAKKVKSKKITIKSIEVNPSPVDGFNLTIYGNLIR